MPEELRASRELSRVAKYDSFQNRRSTSMPCDSNRLQSDRAKSN